MEVPKFPKLGLLQLWGLITLCADLQLRWGMKQSCSPRWELSNGMLQATFKQGKGNLGDSWLLVVRNLIVNLTPGLFFGHNLCFRCPNGSCKPILDIYISINFQWYEELFKPIGFDPWSCPLKVRESLGTLTPKVGVHLGVWGFILSHSLALSGAWDVTLRLPSWPETLQAFALVVSPRPGLQHKFIYSCSQVNGLHFQIVRKCKCFFWCFRPWPNSMGGIPFILLVFFCILLQVLWINHISNYIHFVAIFEVWFPS
jgi:hypothetical protein